MNKTKLITKAKKLLSGVIATAIAISMMPTVPAMTEETTEKYPYTLFAASSEEGAITINASNFCVNGNIATNGTIVSDANINVNGTKTENANEDMIYIFDKIDTEYFSSNSATEYDEDYTLEETNINISTPTEVLGETTLTGNININTALKSLEDIKLYGEVKNTSDSVIFSKYGDIIIDSQNVNLNGLIYAPFGTVEITAQNLNFNNVVIIANTIILNCPNVNANYSNDAAEFVGITSEPLDIPYSEWEYMKDENENGVPDFFEDYNNWDKLLDADGDGLPDSIEDYLGSDSELTDSDGDGLDDFYETFITGTNPAMVDTDEDGITDADEDFDEDGLTNLEEYICGTDPYTKDCDGDGLSDGDEVYVYGTDPLNADTDADGLDDGDEIYFECDPLNPDTDGNGTLDGNEKRLQTFIYEVENECAVTHVKITAEATGNLQKTTEVESIMDKDMLCTDVVGLVGEPFEIETTSEFDTATLTFTIDKELLGDTEFENLLFLWYDEETDEFVELETMHDEEQSSVSVETTHFSKYMLVDQVKWFDAWKNAPDYFESDDYVPYDTVICIDCSGSMSSNDPNFMYYAESSQPSTGRSVNYRILAAKSYIESMGYGDRTALVNYASSAAVVCELTSDKSELNLSVNTYNSGGTNANAAINKAYELLSVDSDENNRCIILLSDGDANITSANITKAVNNGIKIYTVGLGSGASSSTLKDIAKKTGGDFYIASTADELENIYENISWKRYIDTDWTDCDGDGIPDDFEASGLICSNARIYYTKYGDDEGGYDTDGDGLSDGEEIIIEYNQSHISCLTDAYAQSTFKVYFTYNSNPIKKDTDGDGIDDKADGEPATAYSVTYIEKIQDMERYIDEFWEVDEIKSLLQKDLIQYEATSIIAMNIIRDIRYGSGDDELSAFEWYFTSGYAYPMIRDYIDARDPSIMEFFESKKDTSFIDPYGNEIDFLHLLATLSGQYNTNTAGKKFIAPKLSGWAGDLQSLIYDLKKDTYATDKDLKEEARLIISKDDTNFSMVDVLADIDAENIYNLYSASDYLSYMLKDYYSNMCQTRYSMFVEGYGGIEKLEEEVETFTSGSDIIKHRILNNWARNAANDKRIKEAYQNSFVGYELVLGIDKFGDSCFYLCPVYSLPDPKKVTSEESEALTYAFVDFIEDKMYEE